METSPFPDDLEGLPIENCDLPYLCRITEGYYKSFIPDIAIKQAISWSKSRWLIWGSLSFVWDPESWSAWLVLFHGETNALGVPTTTPYIYIYIYIYEDKRDTTSYHCNINCWWSMWVWFPRKFVDWVLEGLGWVRMVGIVAGMMVPYGP